MDLSKLLPIYFMIIPRLAFHLGIGQLIGDDAVAAGKAKCSNIICLGENHGKELLLAKNLILDHDIPTNELK